MYRKNLIFAAACVGMLIFGIVMTTLGSILPSVMEKFPISKIDAGSLMMLMSFGILLGSLFFGPIVDRYGYKFLLILCTGFIIVGLEGIAFAKSFDWLRVFVFLIGLNGGVINGGTNALVADLSQAGKSANLSLLGVFFGLGAIGMPFLLGTMPTETPDEPIIAAIGIAVIIPLVFFVVLRFPKPKQPQGLPIKQGFGLIKNGALLIFGFILFFQSGMEITVSSWTSSYLKEGLHIDANLAVFFLTVYWLGLVITRFILGFILKKMAPALVLYLSLAIAFLGALIMILATSLIPILVGLFFIGIGFAAIFPVILGFVGELFPGLSGTAFSIAFVMALSGGMLAPFFTGIVANRYNMRVSFFIIPIALIFVTLLFKWVSQKINRKNA